jgi:sugar O-acyltransferase (sialic acid O-acetyltransferase NeuD family)
MRTPTDLIIWGGTGNLKVLCELLEGQFRIIGFFDNDPHVERSYRGVPFLGTRDDFLDWEQQLDKTRMPSYLVSIGPGHGKARLDIHNELKAHGLSPIKAIHRTAFVAASAALGEGSQVYGNAAVCVDVRIGCGCIINTSASIDHECVLEDGATIGPGVTLAGMVHVGRNADIYTGATVIPRIRIGAGSIVGAGAVVIEDVPENAVVVGNPARVIRMREA